VRRCGGCDERELWGMRDVMGEGMLVWGITGGEVCVCPGGIKGRVKT